MERSKMSNLSVGFGRANITPPMDIDVNGYFKIRKAEGVLDELEVNAVAISDGNKTALLIAVDNCGIAGVYYPEFIKAISEKTGLAEECIFLHCTHTHTAPSTGIAKDTNDQKLVEDYRAFLMQRCIDVSTFALNDLKPAKMGYGVSKAPNIAFIRRYRMKDGSVKTNPGVLNPDILHPIGELDDSVNVIRFDRENAETVVVVNFANHPDTVGGNLISGDWPTLTRHFVEKAIDNTKCIFFNGAQGDVNHVNVHPTKGDFNDMFNDFDGCSRGYGHTRHMGRVVAGAVMQIYDKVTYTEDTAIRCLQREYDIPANKPDPKDLPLAHKYNDLHNAGKDDEIPYKAMMLTTIVAEAARMVRLENAPDNFSLLFSALAIGKVGLFGIPGEPFNGVGKGVKQTEGYDLIIPCCIVNGYRGYFPMQDAYDEGGYEARSSNFKAGVAEKIIAYGKEMLTEIKM